MIYFAMNGRWDSESRGSWTGISRVPYLKALVMMPKGDCWFGGGLFTSQTTYWLNDDLGHIVLRRNSKFVRDLNFTPAAHFGGECLHVYYNRLMRDGWRMKHAQNDVHAVFEKPLPHGLTLRKLCFAEIGAPPGNGCYYDWHELVTGDGCSHSHPEWQWADRDGNRIVWAESGQLKAGTLGRNGIRGEKVLHDFSEMKFEARAAPY